MSMTDLEARRMASLEARMNRMETMMQELLSTLTTSRAEVERTEHMQTMLQELLIREGIHTRGTSGVNPVAVPPQERPENRAIQEALLAGDNMKAIKLYREIYGVSLQEAAGALRITLHHSR
jgi:ribosomal protein L7/L12